MNNSDKKYNTNTTAQIPNYQIVETIYSGSRTLVYRAIRTSDQLPVVIKLLKNDYPSFSELLQFRNQYTIAKNLNSPLIVQTYSLEPYQNGYALVMEDFGGIPLKEWGVKNAQKPSLKAFLEIAIALCNALDILYHNRIIHKDIKPANILINPEIKQVKLIDFSIASLLPRETQTLINPNVLEGTLAYISPEQTGRMNRGIDYRSDYYALGVTFYELLTGVLPFPSNDPMELVHCHIAKIAPLAHHINVNLPLVLSEIIDKLMAKNAEDRYQNMLGLKHDLGICLQQLITTGKIEYFEIGQRDVSDRFIIPDKLYGRETEVSTLLQAFERVSLGAIELMLVAGFSGIGKTVVVNEVHKPITRQNGYFIKGKFDQFNRDIPLSAFVQAFRNLMGQLLSESDANLQLWKQKILAAVGDSGQVIIEVIPELERVIGCQPPAAELSGTAAQNRFNFLFQKFIQIFTTTEHPLVMFIDDLQWADLASLNLIQVLMAESTTGHLLMIGAYRDNEVFAAHPLMLTLNAVGKAGAKVNTITLEPLSQYSLNHLVADTLNCAETVAQSLTDLVAQKTQGNPFFATQFLKALHQDQLITFDRQLGYWQCDIVRVREAALTDDVVEFMALQLQKLPLETQDVLKLAACIGAQFDLQTLAIVSEQSQTEVATALWKALQEGFILPQSEIYKFYLEETPLDRTVNHEILNYKFLHDRIQQAAYSLIPIEQQQSTHLAIARLLRQNTPETELEAKVFEIVNHWNRVINLILDLQERKNLAQLNLIAGSKAKASTANEPALTYFQTGLTLLSDESWQTEPQLTLALHEGAAEAAYLCGNSDQMEKWVGVILSKNLKPTEYVKAHTIQIQTYNNQGQYQEAIAIARTALARFNLQLPEQPTPADIAPAMEEVRELLNGRTIQELLNLPVMTEAEPLAMMQLLSSIIPTTYVFVPLLFPFVILTQVKLSINRGNTGLSAFSYSNYGVLLSNILGDLDGAYDCGQLALQLVAKLNARFIQPKISVAFSAFIIHCKAHFCGCLPVNIEGVQMGLEIGDLEFVGFNVYGLYQWSYHLGRNLTTVVSEGEPYLAVLSQHNLTVTLNYSHIALQLIQRLQGNQSKADLAAQGEQLHRTFTIANDLTGLHLYWVGRLTVSYLFGETMQASEDAAQARQILAAGAGMLAGGAGIFTEFVFYFYDSLTALAEYPEATDKTALGDRISANQAKLQYRANHAPMNFQHKYDLVEAERYRVFGQNYEAGDYYDRAISGAKANEYIQEEGLANELAAKFYLDWGKEKIAAVYMQEAYYCYAKWGAKAKIDDLETRYPHLLRPILESAAQPINVLETLASIATPNVSLHSSTISSHSSSTRVNSALDFAAILKASQGLSRTIQLEDLLHQLTQIILQNSGGDRCALILPNENQVWEVRAIATPTETKLCSEPLENNPNLPVKLIQYVKNTQQIVVIDDLETDLPVIDNYLTLQQPKSVLCLPVLNQGNLVGILYLKNRLTSGVFTRDRIIILDFLCTQVAISLENARLYNQVQQTLTDLQNAQLQIVQSEKMSALGNLVAGVAHEINNPVGCIIGNVGAVQDSINDLFGLIDLYNDKFPQPGAEIEKELETIDLEYLRDDLPKLIRAMKDGGDRITSISKSLRTFSRADSDQKQTFNLHEGIDSTILILRHRLKANDTRPEIEVINNYGKIPAINCFPGQLNQVFMNILANAIDALEESNSNRSFAEIKADPNRITIQTTLIDNQVKISIADNGQGMNESVKQKIFDHLFTTKAVGKGTGLGLAIARQIVVEKHQGQITVDSIPSEGTVFEIALPVK